MENNQKNISIIIPISYGLEFLKRTLPNMLNINYSNYEIIVADNSLSNDIKEFIDNFPSIIYLKTKPNSKTNASNSAAKIAKGEFLLFLDPDALIDDMDLLNKLIFKSSYNSCYSIKFKNIYTNKFGLGGRLFIFSRYIKKLFEKNNQINNLSIDYPQGIAFFISKKLWNYIGGYDEKISFGCEEIDLGFKIKKSSSYCLLFEDTHIIDLGNPQGKIISSKKNILFSSKKNELMIRGKLFIMRKYYSRFDRLFSIIFLFPIHILFSVINSIKTKNIDYITGVLRVYF